MQVKQIENQCKVDHIFLQIIAFIREGTTEFLPFKKKNKRKKMNHAFGPTASRSATDVYSLSGYYAEETLQSYNSDGVRITS